MIDFGHQFTGADTGVVKRVGFSHNDRIAKRYLWISLLYSVDASSRLIWFVSRKLNIITAIGLEKLTGDTADSPLVLEENQVSYQLVFSYSL